MIRARRMLLPAAAMAVVAAVAPLSSASADEGTSYGATLSALNHATGSGMLRLTLNGNQATITEHWSGLAATFGGPRTRTSSTSTSAPWAPARRWR